MSIPNLRDVLHPSAPHLTPSSRAWQECINFPKDPKLRGWLDDGDAAPKVRPRRACHVQAAN